MALFDHISITLIRVHNSGDMHISFTWDLPGRHEMLTDTALVSIPARHTITVRVRDNIVSKHFTILMINIESVLRSLIQSNRQHPLQSPNIVYSRQQITL